MNKDIINLEKEIPKDSFSPVFKNGKWYKRCLNCGKVFLLKSHHYNQEKYCCSDCKKQKEKNTRRYKFICKNCNKTFYKNQPLDHGRVPQFCCHECSVEYRNKNFKPPIAICPICGKTFIKQNNKSKFCSRKCQSEWQKQYRVREKSPNYNKQISEEQRTAVCQHCGKTYRIKPYKIGDSKYCSQRCRRASCKKSILQQQIFNFVQSINKQAYSEYKFKRFFFDIYIPNTFLEIEVMGDYWHCNNQNERFSNGPIDKIQSMAIIKDYNRQKRIIKAGYKILYIWETDWNTDPEKCKLLIKLFLYCNGKIQNYHSFNYHLENDKIKINNNIVKPYFEEYSASTTERVNSNNRDATV